MADYLADKYFPFRNMTDTPKLAEDTIKPSQKEMEEALDTLKAILPAEEIQVEEPRRPVGELAEEYVNIKNEIDMSYTLIQEMIDRGNKVREQLYKHYGMQVPALDNVREQAPQVATVPQGEGKPTVLPVQTSVADIRANAAMPSGDESSFANNIAASLDRALRNLK